MEAHQQKAKGTKTFLLIQYAAKETLLTRLRITRGGMGWGKKVPSWELATMPGRVRIDVLARVRLFFLHVTELWFGSSS